MYALLIPRCRGLYATMMSVCLSVCSFVRLSPQPRVSQMFPARENSPPCENSPEIYACGGGLLVPPINAQSCTFVWVMIKLRSSCVAHTVFGRVLSVIASAMNDIDPLILLQVVRRLYTVQCRGLLSLSSHHVNLHAVPSCHLQGYWSRYWLKGCEPSGDRKSKNGCYRRCQGTFSTCWQGSRIRSVRILGLFLNDTYVQ